MRMNRFRTLALMAAIAPVLGAHFYTPDDNGGGGGGGGNAADEEKKKKEQEESKKKTVTLTEEELNGRIQQAAADALKRAQDDASKKAQEEADKKKKEEEAEARKKAKDQNDYKTLYESEQARAKEKEQNEAALRLDLRKKDAEIKLRDHLSEKHPEYLGVAKYIMPQVQITADMKDEELAKLVAAAAEQYVKDNPRGKGVGAAPPGTNKGKLGGTGAGAGGGSKKEVDTDAEAKRAGAWTAQRGF